MRDEWLKDGNLSAEESEREQRLVRALEARPAVVIPADFAARIVSQLPARPAITLTPTHYGRRAMVACMIVLGVAMLVAFALHGMVFAPVVRVTVWLLYAQFVGLIVWFGMQGTMRSLR
jgi:hypothetical protein